MGAALTAFTLGGDVNIAAASGANAAEHNALFTLSAIVIAAAYTSYVSYQEGGLYEGLQAIGRGDDPLGQAMQSATETAATWLASEYPEESKKLAAALEASGEVIAEGVQIVLETESGQKLSYYWNELDDDQKAAISGGLTVATFIVPAGVIGKIKSLNNLSVPAGDWVKDPTHPNWNEITLEEKEILTERHRLSGSNENADNLRDWSLPKRESGLSLHDQGLGTKTCAHNSCAMILDDLGRPTDPAALINRMQPREDGINLDEAAILMRQEGVHAYARSGIPVERVKELTNGSRSVVVRVLNSEGRGHAIVVDGFTIRTGANGPIEVVAIRDPAQGTQYFAPLDKFVKYYTEDVLIPNPPL